MTSAVDRMDAPTWEKIISYEKNAKQLRSIDLTCTLFHGLVAGKLGNSHPKIEPLSTHFFEKTGLKIPTKKSYYFAEEDAELLLNYYVKFFNLSKEQEALFKLLLSHPKPVHLEHIFESVRLTSSVPVPASMLFGRHVSEVLSRGEAKLLVDIVKNNLNVFYNFCFFPDGNNSGLVSLFHCIKLKIKREKLETEEIRKDLEQVEDTIRKKNFKSLLIAALVASLTISIFFGASSFIKNQLESENVLLTIAPFVASCIALYALTNYNSYLAKEHEEYVFSSNWQNNQLRIILH